MKPLKPSKRAKFASDFATYVRKVGRKAQRGQEPNDRGYDRELDLKLKRMSPLEIEALSRDEGDDY